MSKGKNKINRKKLIIAVLIILLLLIILFTNRNKLNKNNPIAMSEQQVTINGVSIPIDNVISATPNEPVLGAGMIPIKWNSTVGVWEITTQDDTSWYDYASGNYANIMLSDGKYSSELAIDKELAVKGYHVSTSDLGSIYTWVPKLMYKENEVQYLKQTSFVEYVWTTPSCFTHKKTATNKENLALTGMWVSKHTTTNVAEIQNKNNAMNKEDNAYGLIKNEIAQTLTNEEKTVIEKLNLKCGNVSNETTLSNVKTGEYKQTIKIINTNQRELIVPKHIISGNNIILKTEYSKYGIQLIFDNNANVISKNENANVEDNGEDLSVFYYVDNQGNIKRYSFTIIGKPSKQNLNPNVTFYVTYDEEGNETSCVPIGEKPPSRMVRL